MVLESLMNPSGAEKNPFRMFFYGALYSSAAVLLSLWIFKEHSSLVMIFFTVFACTPLMYNTIKEQEGKDKELDTESSILKEHSKALMFFMMLFFGITVSLTFWYVLLPYDTSSLLFSIQKKTITEINGGVTAFAASGFDIFSRIFLNNVKVLVFCVLFAFIYGMGAIFILVWNASVIAAAMGEFFRARLSEIAGTLGFLGASHYFTAGLMSVMRYAPHGILEIISYFIAGLAGGIISVAVINHDLGTKNFEKIVFDAANLIMISFIILLAAAIVETWVTPLLL